MNWSKRKLLVGWFAWPYKPDGDAGGHEKNDVDPYPPRGIPSGVPLDVDIEKGVIRFEGKLYHKVPRDVMVPA